MQSAHKLNNGMMKTKEVININSLYYLLFCLLLVLLLHFVVSYLIQYKKVSQRTGRRIATGACILLGIPAGMTLGWLWSAFQTTLFSSLIYYIFWGGEQMEIELEKQKQEKIESNNYDQGKAGVAN